jgi:periplasmic divalent cation tolerance protein
MTDYIQIVTTTAGEAEAAAIAETLVQERLAACVQVIGPVASTYWWQGKIETSREWQCWIKSSRDLYDQVEQAIRRLHSYEVPEILAIPILSASAAYLAWLDGEVGTARGKGEGGGRKGEGGGRKG